MVLMNRFAGVEEPVLRCGPSRQWSGLSAHRIYATAGRHTAAARTDHRLVFYETGEVAADCACEGLNCTHALAPGMFDLVSAGAEGAWEDAEPVAFVSVRFPPGLVAATAEALAVRGAVDLAPQQSIADIALQCGFSHQSHLSRWTRRILGVTPAQVRGA